MSWKEEFYKAAGEYVGIPKGAVVTDVSEATYSSGYCDTCFYESTSVTVTYELAGEVNRINSYLTFEEFFAAL